MIPYCIFALLWAAPADMCLKGIPLGQVIRNYALVLNCAQLWFLIMLFLVYIIFYLISDWLIKLPLVGALTLLLMLRLIVSFSEIYIPIGVFSMSNALRYALVYYLGIQCEQAKIETPGWAMTTVLFAVDIAVFVSYVLWFSNSYCVIKEFIMCVMNILGVICLAGFSSTVSKSVVHNRLFKIIAPACMGIYLFHQQIIYAFLHSLSPNSLPPILYALICFVIALSLAYLATIGIRRFRFGRIILGER